MTNVPPPYVPPPPYPYGDPNWGVSLAAAEQAAAQAEAARSVLAVEAYKIPDELPAANMQLATGKWDILHVTDTMLVIKRVAPDDENPYVGPGDQTVERTPVPSEGTEDA